MKDLFILPISQKRKLRHRRDLPDSAQHIGTRSALDPSLFLKQIFSSPWHPLLFPSHQGPRGGAIQNHTVSVSVNWDLCRQTGLCLHPITENLPQELIENQPCVRYGATVTQKTPSCPRGAERSQVPLGLLLLNPMGYAL